jgi:hypothetical protein
MIPPDTIDSDEENHPSRQVLKGLPKRKAPWYFEASLQQRLQDAREQGVKPIADIVPFPAITGAVVLFVALGVTGYFLLTSPLIKSDSEENSPATSQPQEQTEGPSTEVDLQPTPAKPLDEGYYFEQQTRYGPTPPGDLAVPATLSGPLRKDTLASNRADSLNSHRSGPTRTKSGN